MEFISLKFLIFSPLIFSIIFLLPIFSQHEIIVRRFAKGFAGLHFAYSLLFLVCFDNSSRMNFFENIMPFGTNWINSLGINLSIGLDGISLFLVILTSFLVLMSCIATKGIIRKNHSLFFALIFILETSVLGVFAACDMFLFFLFWELELIPMYFLISLWGEDNAKKSAMKFLLYTFIGSIFMLCGFLMLYNFNFITTSILSSNIASLNLDLDSTPMYLQIFASILILFGFAVKMPIIPFHTWLPNAHTDAPVPVSMLLAGLLLKMGAYGIIRFNIQVLSDSFLYIAPYLVIFAFINIIFAAVVAYYQTDIKRIIAYSSISIMGIVLLGLCSLNIIGFSGACFLMLAHGIISSGLFYVTGTIFRRTKTREISQLGGLAYKMPRLAGFALILILAGIGIPGLMGFVGEFMSLFGAFHTILINNYMIQVLSLSAVLILVLSACYSLKFMHKVFYGNILERWTRLKDITNNEFFVLFVFSTIVIIFGIMPMTILSNIQPTIMTIIGVYGG